MKTQHAVTQAPLETEALPHEDGWAHGQARWITALLLATLLLSLAIEVRDAQTRPFWFDELCTVAIAGLGTASSIWDALARAVDTQPPLFYLVSRLGRHLVTDEHLAYRLPALVGFYAVLVCVFAFVKERVGWIGALIAALVASLSGLHEHATDARPYGFELGCLALALLCWQRLGAGRAYAIVFGLALTAAVASHYYAVLTLPAFAIGEAIRTHRTRTIRFSAWIALAVSVVPMIIALPLVSATRAMYGAHFWSHATPLALVQSYVDLTGIGLLTVGVVGVLGIAMLGMLIPTKLPSLFARGLDRIRPEEAAIVAFLLCLPALTFVAAKATQGGLLMRYVLPTVLGLSIGAGLSVSWLGRVAGATLLAVLIVCQGFSLVIGARTVFSSRASSVAQNSPVPQLERMLRDLEPADLPVVVSSGVDYLRLAYYSGPQMRGRLLTLADPTAAVAFAGTDQVDKAAALLEPLLPLRVEEYEVFRKENRRFFLLSTGTTFDWWPRRLIRDGHTLTLRQVQGQHRLFEVELVDGSLGSEASSGGLSFPGAFDPTIASGSSNPQ